MGKQDLFENGNTPFDQAMVRVTRSEFPHITKALDELNKKLPHDNYQLNGKTHQSAFNDEVRNHAIDIMRIAGYPYAASGRMENWISTQGVKHEISIYKADAKTAENNADMLTKPSGLGGFFNGGDNKEERKTKSLEAFFEKHGVAYTDAMKAEVGKLKDCVANPKAHDDNPIISDKVLADQKAYEIASLARSGQLKGGYSPAHAGTAVIQAGRGGRED